MTTPTPESLPPFAEPYCRDIEISDVREYGLACYAAGAADERAKMANPTHAQVNSACMWFRHDFGLLSYGEQETLRFSATEWLRAWGKEFEYAALEFRKIEPLLFRQRLHARGRSGPKDFAALSASTHPGAKELSPSAAARAEPPEPMRCVSCGRPYRPSTLIAPFAAAGSYLGQMTNAACECGSTSFEGTTFSGAASPQPPAEPRAEPMQRDARRGGDSYEASMLRNLLARIHGDGGHYVEEHGLDKALEDADTLVAKWRAPTGVEALTPQLRHGLLALAFRIERADGEPIPVDVKAASAIRSALAASTPPGAKKEEA